MLHLQTEAIHRFDSTAAIASSKTAQSAILKAGLGCEDLALPCSASTGSFPKRGTAGDFFRARSFRGGESPSRDQGCLGITGRPELLLGA